MQGPALVSFIVPAYNHARYIGLCLDRIAAEPYPAKELVIIDDGSTDDTRKVIEAWIARHRELLPIRFRSRANRGLTATLNELISDSAGQYLRLCASDDYVVPGSLGELVQTLEARPNKGVAFGDALVMDQDDREICASAIFQHFRGRKRNYFSDKGLSQEIVYRWSLPGPVALIRRTLYQEIGLYEETMKVEDWDFYLRAAARNQLIFVDRIVAAYRIHTDNSFSRLKRKNPLANARDHLRALQRNQPLFSGALRRELSYRLLKQRAVVAALEQGQPPSRLGMLKIRITSRWHARLGQVT